MLSPNLLITQSIKNKKNQLSKSYTFKYKKLKTMKKLIFLFQNLNIRTRSEITELKLKIPEPDPKCKSTRKGSISLYRNTRKSEIPDPNRNAHP